MHIFVFNYQFIPKKKMHNFSESLIQWYTESKRDLPWRKDNFPYNIFISEYILQQTRVKQGTSYFTKFIRRFPGIKELATATIEEVLKQWQGLGYYSRARNLHISAKIILEKYDCRIPQTYEDLIKLKGIGSYTAAAIASIAFNQPVPVVDGNVIRFFSRFFGIDWNVYSGLGRKNFFDLAVSILNRQNPGLHNQAVMEFGALQCTPKPECETCFLMDSCYAYKEKKVDELPLKRIKTKKRDRYFSYLFIYFKEYTFLKQRQDNDIWKLLYEFPLIESDTNLTPGEIVNHQSWKKYFKNVEHVEITESSRLYLHQLSHQRIHAKFFKVKINQVPDFFTKDMLQVKLNELDNYAIPRLIDKYLEDEK